MTDVFELVGTVIDDKYRVDEVIGEGGFGIVYRGHHEGFDLPVAIKCLKVPAHFTEEARELFLAKFREEGKHLAQLSEHPSITRVFDLGTAKGKHGLDVPYLVLEWLDGVDLEQLIERRRERDRRFSALDALTFLRGAIDALAFAHRAGVAHRDIKPANLMWVEGKRGHVLKVLDFGIAKAMQEGETATVATTKTSSGFSAFSPRYGSPEQFRPKKFGATGPWTDVHALGLVLVEMLTGRHALGGDEMADYLLACNSEKRPTPHELGADVPPEIEALCAKALARSPKDRFADAGELLAAVDALVGSADDVASRLKSIAALLEREEAEPPPDEQALALADTAAFLSERGLDVSGDVDAPSERSREPDATAAEDDDEERRISAPDGPSEPGPLAHEATPLLAEPVAEARRSPWLLLGLGVAVAAAGVVGFLALSDREARVSSPPPAEPTPGLSASLPPPKGCPEGMVLLEGGAFEMGSDAGEQDEQPVHRVEIAPFCIDATEVTVAAYRTCVEAKRCAGPRTGGLAHYNWGAEGRDEHPINGVTWTDAYDFCKFKHRRLPSEAEWELAARGAERRTYPWGEAAPGGQLCWRREDGTCPVGTHLAGATPEGVHDLAGNVLEWVGSRYCPYPDRRCDQNNRVERGGGWNYDDAFKMRGANRVAYSPDKANDHLGFRCARKPL